MTTDKDTMEPAALLKRVAMPGWVEMRVTKIDLRTDAARRFAVCTLDHWAGTPEKSEPQVVVKPRAVAAHERASALLGSWVAWTIVVVSCAAVLFDRGSPRVGVWVCWLIVVAGTWLVRETTKAAVLRPPQAGQRCHQGSEPKVCADVVG